MGFRRWIGAIAALLLAGGLLAPGVSAETPPGTLITGVTVSYSWGDGDPLHLAPDAIDGDPSTWWVGYSSGEGAAVLNLDLGGDYTVTGIELQITDWTQCPITVSGVQADGATGTWLGAFDSFVGDATLGLTLTDPTSFRFVQVRYDPTAGTGCYGGLREVRVYAESAFHYDFTGFFAPVDNGMLNVAKAGSAIPVKFSLGGDQGLDIFAAGYPKAVAVACETGEVLDAIETYAAGGSGLQYDPVADQYTYVWKTQKAWSGCYEFQMQLADGSVHLADFRFK